MSKSVVRQRRSYDPAVEHEVMMLFINHYNNSVGTKFPLTNEGIKLLVDTLKMRKSNPKQKIMGLWSSFDKFLKNLPPSSPLYGIMDNSFKSLFSLNCYDKEQIIVKFKKTFIYKFFTDCVMVHNASKEWTIQKLEEIDQQTDILIQKHDQDLINPQKMKTIRLLIIKEIVIAMKLKDMEHSLKQIVDRIRKRINNSIKAQVTVQNLQNNTNFVDAQNQDSESSSSIDIFENFEDIEMPNYHSQQIEHQNVENTLSNSNTSGTINNTVHPNQINQQQQPTLNNNDDLWNPYHSDGQIPATAVKQAINTQQQQTSKQAIQYISDGYIQKTNKVPLQPTGPSTNPYNSDQDQIFVDQKKQEEQIQNVPHEKEQTSMDDKIGISIMSSEQ